MTVHTHESQLLRYVLRMEVGHHVEVWPPQMRRHTRLLRPQQSRLHQGDPHTSQPLATQRSRVLILSQAHPALVHRAKPSRRSHSFNHVWQPSQRPSELSHMRRLSPQLARPITIAVARLEAMVPARRTPHISPHMGQLPIRITGIWSRLAPTGSIPPS